MRTEEFNMTKHSFPFIYNEIFDLSLPRFAKTDRSHYISPPPPDAKNLNRAA